MTLILSQMDQVRYAIKKSIREKKNDDENVRLIRQRDYLLCVKARSLWHPIRMKGFRQGFKSRLWHDSPRVLI